MAYEFNPIMANELATTPEKLNPDQLDKLYKRHQKGTFVRIGAILFMYLFALGIYLFDIIEKNHIANITFCVGLLILLNPVSLWILKHISSRKALTVFSILVNFLEIIGYTAIIYFLGGINALFLSPIYCAVIAYVGVIGKPNLPFIIVVLCSVSLGLMGSLEYFGYIPHHDPFVKYQLPNTTQVTFGLANVCFLFTVAFITSYTSGIIKRNKKKVHEQNVELRKSQKKIKFAAERLEGNNIELKIAAQKASDSDRLKSEFLANMGHELRTPLNHIIGFTELVLDSNFGKLNATQKEYITDVHDSGKHLLSLVNDLLDLSKIESGRLKIEVSDVNLRELLEKSMTNIEDRASERKIKLSIEFDGIPKSIKSDERRLKQVMYNLLSNALKFTNDGGAIAISASTVDCYTRKGLRDGDNQSLNVIFDPSSNDINAEANSKKCIEIAVSDTGIGIQPEDHKRIFNRFEQLDGTAQKKYQGTGLGLALTKRLVELVGGKIWVESQGKNKGSTFRFIISA